MSGRSGAAELRQRADALRWFHTIDLGDGVVTQGEDASLEKLSRLRLPSSLAGKTVLDVGAWDGFFSFEAEKRGAARVVAVDPACWNEPAWGSRGWGTRQGFDLAHEALSSRVEPVMVDALESLSPESVGRFDVVLFLGVLYHLLDPWPVLHRVAGLATERLIVETHADFLGLRRPAAAYYAGDDVGGDESNYWGPNAALLAEQLRQAGFMRMTAYYERLPYRVARSLYRRVRGPRYGVQQGRLTMHAFRR